MNGLLQKYTEMFQIPTMLPPERDIEHHITLKEGLDHVNVCPYHYAHFQKEEIEKQVNEILQTGSYAAVPVCFHLRYFWLRRKMGRGGFALTISV